MERFGHLWQGRYKAILVEPGGRGVSDKGKGSRRRRSSESRGSAGDGKRRTRTVCECPQTTTWLKVKIRPRPTNGPGECWNRFDKPFSVKDAWKWEEGGRRIALDQGKR
jgi:hypothetical protein